MIHRFPQTVKGSHLNKADAAGRVFTFGVLNKIALITGPESK